MKCLLFIANCDKALKMLDHNKSTNLHMRLIFLTLSLIGSINKRKLLLTKQQIVLPLGLKTRKVENFLGWTKTHTPVPRCVKIKKWKSSKQNMAHEYLIFWHLHNFWSIYNVSLKLIFFLVLFTPDMMCKSCLKLEWSLKYSIFCEWKLFKWNKWIQHTVILRVLQTLPTIQFNSIQFDSIQSRTCNSIQFNSI